jgi:glutamate:Na+ symporter, ESS family
MGRSMSSILLCFVVLGICNLIAKVRFFIKYRIQGSLIAGILGLIFFTIFSGWQSSVEYISWKDWPSITIALVFSALFLEIREEENEKGNFIDLYTQTSFLYIAIVGQMFIGVVATLLFFGPVFGLPMAFSSVLENGFAGGHGTAVAMKQAYIDNNLPNGTEFALFSATIGIILGISGGIFIVETSGYKKKKSVDDVEYITSFDIPKLFINLGIICGSVYIGFLSKNEIKNIFPTLPEFPLFVYALLFSVIIRNFLIMIGKKKIIDNAIISFLSNFFMEILIFTAISTMNLDVISEALLPMLILFGMGFSWNLFCHYYIRKKLLPEDISFELSILNFGMLNGTTAIGLMLLKMIDPELKSRAMKVYAESAPLTSPVIGGGALTLSLPYLISNLGAATVIGILFLIIISFYISALIIRKRNSLQIGIQN